jgi:peptidoglycan/xylan/chitin deacetylase (PgdA/CDA1 family)
MPYIAPYNLEASTTSILNLLRDFDAQALFFVVGRLAEEHPDIIRRLVADGHEIGLHGYDHDHLQTYDDTRLAQFDRDLSRVESLLEQMSGKRPQWFRAPYLLAPRFHRTEVSRILARHGYRWISNREIRYPVELLRPGRFPFSRAWMRSDKLFKLVVNRPALAALNPQLLVDKGVGSSAAVRLRWLLGDREPFVRDGLVEVPVYSPLDCDLVGLPSPNEDTEPDLLRYARSAIRLAVAGGPATSMVTFHDWIVSGGNRLVLLRDAMEIACEQGLPVQASVGEKERS